MNVISGWAYDPSNPTASVNVEVVITGGPTQTISADQSRSDLQRVIGSSNHGFTYSTPMLSAGSHTAYIYAVEADGTKVLLNTETLVSQNSLFDEHYYLEMNPDVAAAVAPGEFATGYDHYIEYGQFEGRSPSPYWDEAYYLQQNPDVAAAVKAGTISSGFMHYYLYGQYENRGGLLYFNTAYYLQNNPDVAAAITAGTITSAFEHFVLYGQYEGRSPMLYFSSAVYDADNQDILPFVTGETFSSDYEQFVEFGQYEGRIASNFYNEQIYLADNPDVAAAVLGGRIPRRLPAMAGIRPIRRPNSGIKPPPLAELNFTQPFRTTRATSADKLPQYSGQISAHPSAAIPSSAREESTATPSIAEDSWPVPRQSAHTPLPNGQPVLVRQYWTGCSPLPGLRPPFPPGSPSAPPSTTHRRSWSLPHKETYPGQCRFHDISKNIPEAAFVSQIAPGRLQSPPPPGVRAFPGGDYPPARLSKSCESGTSRKILAHAPSVFSLTLQKLFRQPNVTAPFANAGKGPTSGESTIG